MAANNEFGQFVLVGSHGVKTLTHNIPEGINPNSDTASLPGIPILVTMIVRLDYDSAKRLVYNHKANVNIQEWRESKCTESGISGVSPLMATISRKGPLDQKEYADVVDMATFLLNTGADPNLKDGNGWNALCYAVNNNSITEIQKIGYLELLRKYKTSEEMAVKLADRIELKKFQGGFYRRLNPFL